MVAALKRSQAVIEFALDGTILEANENFLSVMGYRLDEVQGAHHRIFVDPPDANTPAYADLWRAQYPSEFFLPPDKRTRFYLSEEYPPHLKPQVADIYPQPGFFRNLPPMPGGVEAVRQMVALGHTSAEEIAMDPSEVALLDELHAQGRLDDAHARYLA